MSVGLVLSGIAAAILALKLPIYTQGYKKLRGYVCKGLFILISGVAILASLNRTSCIWQDYQEGSTTSGGRIMQVHYVRSEERRLWPLNECTKMYPNKTHVLKVRFDNSVQVLTLPERMATALFVGQQIDVSYYPHMLWVRSIKILPL